MSLTVDFDYRSKEVERVEEWRLRTLLQAGYPTDVAEQLAPRAEVDLHQAVDLLKQGCPAALASRILA